MTYRIDETLADAGETQQNEEGRKGQLLDDKERKGRDVEHAAD